MTIRLLCEKDIPAVLEIYRPYIETSVVTFEYEVPSLLEFTKRVHAIQQEFPWLVCEIGGEVIGYAYASHYHDRAAYFWDCELSVYVKQGVRRQGVGTALYQALLPLLKAQGYYQAYAVIAAPNPQSQLFHQKLGFRSLGIHPKVGFKFGEWRDLDFQVLELREKNQPAQFPVPFPKLEAVDRETVL